MKYMFVFLTIMPFFLSSCNRCKDAELSLKKSDYTGNEMRIDGYYYSENTVNDQADYAIFVFFQNGTFYSRFSDSLEQAESDMINGTFVANSEIKLSKLSWGRYQVNSNTISTDSWKLRQCGYPAVLLSGAIINDSTIEIGNHYFKDNDVLTYKFKPFSPKPDSTNVFV